MGWEGSSRTSVTLPSDLTVRLRARCGADSAPEVKRSHKRDAGPLEGSTPPAPLSIILKISSWTEEVAEEGASGSEKPGRFVKWTEFFKACLGRVHSSQTPSTMM